MCCNNSFILPKKQKKNHMPKASTPVPGKKRWSSAPKTVSITNSSERNGYSKTDSLVMIRLFFPSLCRAVQLWKSARELFLPVSKPGCGSFHSPRLEVPGKSIGNCVQPTTITKKTLKIYPCRKKIDFIVHETKIKYGFRKLTCCWSSGEFVEKVFSTFDQRRFRKLMRVLGGARNSVFLSAKKGCPAAFLDEVHSG